MTSSELPRTTARSIGKNSVVTINYTVRDRNGRVLETTEGTDPIEYLHGHRNVVRGLENAIDGRQVGYRQTVTLPPSEAYGDYDATLVMKLPRSAFEGEDELEVGAIVELEGDEGEVVLGRVQAVDKKKIVVDANHPLAGQDLIFDFEVLACRAATLDEIEHGHVHTAECGHHH